MMVDKSHWAYTPNHPTINVNGVDIDEQLAPLIRILWGLDIETGETCQEEYVPDIDYPFASIFFHDLQHAGRFLALLARGNPDATDWEAIHEEPTPEGFRVSTMILVEEKIATVPPQPWTNSMIIDVAFPTSKIAELTEGIRKYLTSLGD